MTERDGDGSWEWLEPEAEPGFTDTPSIETSTDLETSSPRRKGKWKIYGALLLTAALGVVGAEIVKNTKAIKTKNGHYIIAIFPKIVQQPIHRDRNVGCPPVDAQELKKVKKILHRPLNPGLSAIEKSTHYQDPLYDPRYAAFARKEAKANHLTLIHDEAYVHRLDNLAVTGSLDEKLKIVDEYTQKYGFGVDIYRGKDSGGDIIPFSPSELGSDHAFDDGLINLIGAFRFLPVEEVRATGLRKIEIVKGFRRGKDSEPDIAAQAVGANLIQISLNTLVSDQPSYEYHEMGHLTDYNFCGNFGFNYYDPSYDNLNPGDFEYGTGGYWRNATVSQYGSSNMREDKAEMYSQMLGGIDWSDVHSSYKAIRQKYVLLLSRLNQKAPGIASYLEEVSPKPR